MGSSPWRSWTHKRPRTRSESMTWLILSAGWRYLGETCLQFIQLRPQKLTTSITPYALDNGRRCPRQPHVGDSCGNHAKNLFSTATDICPRRLGDRWTVGECSQEVYPYGLTTRIYFIFAKGLKLHFSLLLKRGITLRHTLPPKCQNNKLRVFWGTAFQQENICIYDWFSAATTF